MFKKDIALKSYCSYKLLQLIYHKSLSNSRRDFTMIASGYLYEKKCRIKLGKTYREIFILCSHLLITE